MLRPVRSRTSKQLSCRALSRLSVLISRGLGMIPKRWCTALQPSPRLGEVRGARSPQCFGSLLLAACFVSTPCSQPSGWAAQCSSRGSRGNVDGGCGVVPHRIAVLNLFTEPGFQPHPTPWSFEHHCCHYRRIEGGERMGVVVQCVIRVGSLLGVGARIWLCCGPRDSGDVI